MAKKKVASLEEHKRKTKVEEPSPEEKLEVEMEIEEDKGEVYTIDLGKGVIYGKNNHYPDEKLVPKKMKPADKENFKALIQEMAEPIRPENQRKFETHLTSLLVESALVSLYKQTQQAREEMQNAMEKHREILRNTKIVESLTELERRCRELKEAVPYIDFGGGTGVINYERVPDWAHPYVLDFMSKCLKNLASLCE